MNYQEVFRKDRILKILLVIDIQPAFKREPYYSRVLDYIAHHSNDYDQVIATRFINKADSVFVKKLGYMDAMKKEPLEFNYDMLIGKITCGIGQGYCQKILKGNDVTVIGCDTDACVLETCFQMFQNDVDFRILKEYCYSTGGQDYHEAGLKVMERNFGKDCIQ